MLRGKSKKGYKNIHSREVLEQVKRNADTDCGSQLMRRGYLAMKNGSWEEFKERYRGKKKKSSEWTLERMREAYEKVTNDEIGRLGIVQEILRKSTAFLRRVIAPVGGMESHFVVCRPALQQFSFGGLLLVGIDGTRRRQQQKEDALQLVVCGMWRQIRMESAQQDTGCAARYQCQ